MLETASKKSVGPMNSTTEDPFMIKVKWKVSEPPTGRYRSFHRRGWPTATYATGQICAQIRCDDDYYPKAVKAGEHAPLTLLVADHRDKCFKYLRVTQQFKTLAELKRWLDHRLQQNPPWLPVELRTSGTQGTLPL